MSSIKQISAYSLTFGATSCNHNIIPSINFLNSYEFLSIIPGSQAMSKGIVSRIFSHILTSKL